MAVVTLAVSGDLPDFQQRTSLDGRDYILTFVHNQRLGRWSLDIADQDAVAIASGVRLATNFPLLKFITDARRPPGELYVLDLEGSDEATATQLNQATRDAGLDELGVRFQLVYLDAEELGRA